MTSRIIVGADLSGPANAADTALVWFLDDGSKSTYLGSAHPASDADIVRIVSGLMAESTVVVGLDAPLSYNDGGSDRPADKDLRRVLVNAGMRSGSVMTPLAPRMVYLTLRGLGVARLLQHAGLRADAIVEVHPGGAFTLNGAPLQHVLDFKSNPSSRDQLVKWLPQVNAHGAPLSLAGACHLTAACGAFLAARNWARGTTRWLWKASPPHHPFDFAC